MNKRVMHCASMSKSSLWFILQVYTQNP